MGWGSSAWRGGSKSFACPSKSRKAKLFGGMSWDFLGYLKKFETIRGPKKHINFFNINFLAPTQNTLVWPPEKSLCASFPGKGRKKGIHINFSWGFLGSKRVSQNGTFSATKSSVHCFFLPLSIKSVFKSCPLCRSKREGDWGT